MPSSILLVAIAFPPDPITGAARPGRFAKYLPQFGYSAEVIAGSGSVRENTASVRRVPSSAPARADRFAYQAAAVLQRTLLPYNDSVPWAASAFREACGLYQSNGPLPVISTSPPLGCHLVGLRLKLRYGVPWIADFRDPLLGNPFRTRRWFIPFDPWVERLIFQHTWQNSGHAGRRFRRWEETNKKPAGFSGYRGVGLSLVASTAAVRPASPMILHGPTGILIC